MNYQSKNPKVRELLDRPRWQEWIEFEIEHIRSQMKDTAAIPGESHLNTVELIREFPQATWELEVRNGGHEVERMLHHLAKLLVDRYHQYLHRGLTSSNVIDSCNHRRWNKLMWCLYDTKKELDSAAEVMRSDPHEVPGFTHGRAAHRTHLRTRYGSLWLWHEGDMGNYALHEDIDGGPTGNAWHRQAVPRSYYWGLWAALARSAYGLEQLATDYRFYCSSFAHAIGVTGMMDKPITSSAMPGKMNPTPFERVCSVGQMVRSMCTAQMMLPPKWLDADLVHSAMERETIDRIWDHSIWMMEEMIQLVKTTLLRNDRLANGRTSFDELQHLQQALVEYSEARRLAARHPCG